VFLILHGNFDNDDDDADADDDFKVFRASIFAAEDTVYAPVGRTVM
jgi:hypothetical protein